MNFWRRRNIRLRSWIQWGRNKLKLNFLPTESKVPEDYLAAVARSVGCKTPEEIAEFLNPEPPIHNHTSFLSDYESAKTRILDALKNRESISIYGDYDTDGITSLVQMYNFLETAGCDDISWFIPDRMTDDYGLSVSALERCIGQYKPDLLISVDCGSNSMKEIEWLKQKGIDCIVIDHHEVVSSELHPTVAHLNPKAEMKIDKRMAMLSASGLTFMFCEQLAKDMPLPRWNRNRALLLAGLGTIVDVMPLIDVNRALAKHSIRLANDENELNTIPGLIALKNISDAKTVNSYTYAFQWGPRLNAMGRLEDATISVKLLMSKTLTEAEAYAKICDMTNRERQAIQETIIEEAEFMALQLLKQNHKVLIVCGKGWHMGVVGIVASKIREKYNRPAIVCGWNETDKCWKGSGRSMVGFDMGAATDSAVKEKILLRGGGHQMACGLSFTDDKLQALRNWMNQKCPLTEDDFVPSYNVMGNMFNLHPETWSDVYKQLEPHGNGNPKPHLYARGKLMWSGEKRTKNDERVWGISAGFRCDDGPDKLVYFVWTDIDRASSEWQKGGTYQLVLSLKKSGVESPEGKKTYYNWYVEDCKHE